MRGMLWTAVLLGTLLPGTARADTTPSPQGMPVFPETAGPRAPARAGEGTASPVAPEAGPALPSPSRRSRILEETALETMRDSGGARVMLRVPAALHRPANAFRLHGTRPLTLWQRERRRDLYRDAFLELATRSFVSPKTAAWESLPKQLEWLRSQAPAFAAPGKGSPGDVALRLPLNARDASELLKALHDTADQVRSLPGYGNLNYLTRLLGAPEADVSGPVSEGLELRALATDQAEARLVRLGEALKVEAPGADPALREGYRAARAEFVQVRQGLWPAVTASLKRNQGRLVASVVKEVALSHLGFWALFGYLGWQGVEGTLNTEYRGQYAVALATLAGGLAEAARAAPGLSQDALYAEYATNYELTEALKDGSVMAWKPAGGRAAGSWQVQFAGRCEELRGAFRE